MIRVGEQPVQPRPHPTTDDSDRQGIDEPTPQTVSARPHASERTQHGSIGWAFDKNDTITEDRRRSAHVKLTTGQRQVCRRKVELLDSPGNGACGSSYTHDEVFGVRRGHDLIRVSRDDHLHLWAFLHDLLEVRHETVLQL